MNIIEYENVRSFFNAVEPFLSGDEVVHNLPLGLLASLAGRDATGADEQPYMALVEENGAVQLVLLMTSGQNLILAGGNHPEALAAAADHLSANGPDIPGVIGVADLAEAFADRFSLRTGLEATVRMRQRIYRLDRVETMGNASGFLRVATEDDVEIIGRWLIDFEKEALVLSTSEEEARIRAERGVKDGSIHIWDDGGPVSMAKRSRPTRRGIVINMVYTPPERRGRGYATSGVAALSQKCLDDGYDFCSLYTDLNNPTSNGIYQKIGYRPVADSLVYAFDRKPILK